MKFEEKSFSSRPSSDAYRDNWEATFGKKSEVKLCSFTLPPCCLSRTPIGQGHVPGQRCALSEGHDGNHQLEAV